MESAVATIFIALGTLAIVFGFGIAWGSILGRWRYGHGLGERIHRTFSVAPRYGLVVAGVGAVLIALGAAASLA